MASWPGAQTRTAQLQPSPKTSGSWTLSGQVVTSSAWRSMPRQEPRERCSGWRLPSPLLTCRPAARCREQARDNTAEPVEDRPGSERLSYLGRHPM